MSACPFSFAYRLSRSAAAAFTAVMVAAFVPALISPVGAMTAGTAAAHSAIPHDGVEAISAGALVSCMANSAIQCVMLGQTTSGQSVAAQQQAQNPTNWTASPTTPQFQQVEDLNCVPGSGSGAVAAPGGTTHDGGSISCIAGVILAGAANATLVHSTNGGSAWTQASTIPPEVSQNTPTYSAVSCPSAAACFAIGSAQNSTQTGSWGFFMSTSDGGNSWSNRLIAPRTSGGTGNDLCLKGTTGSGDDCAYTGLSCPSTTVCSAGFFDTANGDQGVIETTDGGNTWTLANIGSVNDVSCPSTTVCYAVAGGGSTAQLLGTCNGGTSWNTDSFTNPSTGGICGTGSSLRAPHVAPRDLSRITPVHISCGSTTTCEVVATTAPGGGGSTTVMVGVSGSGATVTQQSVPSQVTSISGVSCFSASSCSISSAQGTGSSRQGAVYTSSNGFSTFSPVTISGTASCAGGGGSAPSSPGYWMLSAAGTVYNFGSAASLGSATSLGFAVGMAATPDGAGYWVASPSGAVQCFGDAPLLTPSGTPTSGSVVTIAATKSGKGFWEATSNGQVITAGDAQGFGNAPPGLAAAIVDMAPTPDGGGYWLLAGDGGVFAFGDAGFFGSTGNLALSQPAIAMAPTKDGAGYWFVAKDGGIFAFGDAGFYGSSQRINPTQPPGGTNAFTAAQPIIGIVATSSGKGYWMSAADGGVFAFGDAGFVGSLGSNPPPVPIVAFAPV